MFYIYKIINNKSLKIYIGSTKNPEVRFKSHLYNLKRNKHHSQHFQNFYNKNLDCNYSMVILSKFEKEIDAKEVEELLLNSDLNYLLNVSKKSSGGDLISYHPDNLKIRENMRQLAKINYDSNFNFKNYPKLGNKNPNYKHGLYIERVLYCSEGCGVQLKTMTATTCSSCLAKNKTGILNSFYNKKHTEESKDKIRKSKIGKTNKACSKQISIEGIVYSSLSKAAQELNIHPTTLSYRARSKTYLDIFYVK